MFSYYFVEPVHSNMSTFSLSVLNWFSERLATNKIDVQIELNWSMWILVLPRQYSPQNSFTDCKVQ